MNNNRLNIEFMEVSEVAKWLHVSVKTIYNLIYSFKKGKSGISTEFYIKIGKKFYLSRVRSSKVS